MRICLVSHNAYGALIGENQGHVGGVERQTALLAQWLVNQGHHVSVITWDEGGDNVEQHNGIEIIKLCRENEGVPSLRFFFPRWSSLITALRSANAEVYYHNCAEYFTGQIALWCKLNKRAFIYSVASDIDCQLNPIDFPTCRERLFFRFGLKNANSIICQTKHQKTLLHENFHLDATVIPMPTTPPDGKSNLGHQFQQQTVIWVGRVETVKRLEWLIDIASALPQFNFEIIGPTNDNESYTNTLVPMIETLANIKLIGKLSQGDMAKAYKNASLLCSTSLYEGFPNTYLEAWSYGLPVVATVDPDNIINEYNLGYTAKEKQALITAIEQLLTDKSLWQTCSYNSQNYYKQNHNFEQCQKAFEAEFLRYTNTKNNKAIFDKQDKFGSDP